MRIQDDSAHWDNPLWCELANLIQGLAVHPMKTLLEILGSAAGENVARINEISFAARCSDKPIFELEHHDGGRRFLIINHPGPLDAIRVKVAEPIHPTYDAETTPPKLRAIEGHLQAWQAKSIVSRTAEPAGDFHVPADATELLTMFTKACAELPDAQVHVLMYRCDERGSCQLQPDEPDPMKLFHGDMCFGSRLGVKLASGEFWGFDFAHPCGPTHDRAHQRFRSTATLAGSMLSLESLSELGVRGVCSPLIAWLAYLMQRVDGSTRDVGRHKVMWSPVEASITAAKQLQAAERLGAGDKPPAAKLAELKPWAMEAWRANQAGVTKKKIAAILSSKYGDKYGKISQPRVSEQVRLAQAHTEASGLADVAAAALSPTTSVAGARTMDPASIDQGRRTDRRASHLRDKARQIAKEE